MALKWRKTKQEERLQYSTALKPLNTCTEQHCRIVWHKNIRKFKKSIEVTIPHRLKPNLYLGEWGKYQPILLKLILYTKPIFSSSSFFPSCCVTKCRYTLILRLKIFFAFPSTPYLYLQTRYSQQLQLKNNISFNSCSLQLK